MPPEQVSLSGMRRRQVRNGYWSTWTFGLLAFMAVLQAILCMIALNFYPVLWTFAMMDISITLIVAAIALVISPAIVHVPHETRLRLEEWVLLDVVPENAVERR